MRKAKTQGRRSRHSSSHASQSTPPLAMPARPPIFDLQPLEQRLFLSITPSNVALANYVFDTGTPGPAVPDSPIGWWSSNNVKRSPGAVTTSAPVTGGNGNPKGASGARRKGGNLSRTCQWLQTTYATRFNRRHRRCGHLFQGRFKAHLVEADSYAKQLVRYVHLNPVRPRDKRQPVPPERREEFEAYRWSSHRAYAGTAAKGETPEWLSLEWLAYWSDAAGTIGGRAGGAEGRLRRAYRADLAGCFGQAMPSPLEAAKGGLVLGGEALWEKAKALLDGRQGRKSVEAEGVLRWERRHGAEAVAARVRELALAEQDKRVRVWLRVRLGGERLTDVARAEGYRDGSGVLHAVQRLEAAASGLKIGERMAQLRLRFSTDLSSGMG